MIQMPSVCIRALPGASYLHLWVSLNASDGLCLRNIFLWELMEEEEKGLVPFFKINKQ